MTRLDKLIASFETELGMVPATTTDDTVDGYGVVVQEFCGLAHPTGRAVVVEYEGGQPVRARVYVLITSFEIEP